MSLERAEQGYERDYEWAFTMTLEHFFIMLGGYVHSR